MVTHKAAEHEMHERVTVYYAEIAKRFSIIVALRQLGYDAHEIEKVIVIYDLPDGEGWRKFTTNEEAQLFLFSVQAIEDGGCE